MYRSAALYSVRSVSMSSLPEAEPVMNGAPGARSWWMTRPNSDSARPCTIWPACVMGDVAPAIGAGA